MGVPVQVGSDVVVVEVAGEIDLATIGALRARLMNATWLKPQTIVVDLAAVTFMGACGIGILVEMQNYQRDHGGTMVLVGLSPPIYRIMELTGLADFFPVHVTITAAYAALAG